MSRRSVKVSEKARPAPALPAQEAGTTSGRRERKLQNTIDHIGAVAWNLFETHGFDAVTMEAIAEAADVAKGTLYKHFAVKEALIQHRFEKDMLKRRDKVGAAVMAKPTCAERLTRLLHEEAIYVDKMRPYFGHYIRYRLGSKQAGLRGTTSSSLENFIAGLLRLGQASGEIGSDLSAERMAEYLSFLRLATLMHWLATPGASLRTMHEEMLNLFLNGISRKAQS